MDFLQHEFVTYSIACEYYRLGIKPLTRMVYESGSVYKIGKKVLIRRSIFEAYLREQRKG
ncbi:MAG: DUF6462 family protein [Clostridiales bacterium]|nr:DUF6462 family protein [Clostridiales bacterium]